MKPSILIVDDEPSICTSLHFALRGEYQVKTAGTAEGCIEMIVRESFDVILLDLRLGKVDGIDVLMRIKELDPSIVVIIMTAFGSIRSSVDAMKRGAFTYLTKPLDIEELKAFIRQAVEFRSLKTEVNYLADELKERQSYDCMVGKSAPIQEVYRLIDRVKDIDSNVLILGESGTGKELVARAIHNTGNRRDKRFVVVNCAAIPENLLESEFFGHRRGAFTGALQDHKGKFELADNGTIFLDEIGDMPLALQAKLLRVLENKEFSPLGSEQSRRVNVRVIAATNCDLQEMVQNNRFREDLYYRLSVMTIRVPPLRQRKEDIPLFCQHFIRRFSKEQNKQIYSISPEAEQLLMEYHFPGNIRQLANILEYAMILCAGRIIQPEELPEELHTARQGSAPDMEQMPPMTLQELECVAIRAALKRNHGHRDQSARELGISTRGLFNKIREYGLDAK